MRVEIRGFGVPPSLVSPLKSGTIILSFIALLLILSPLSTGYDLPQKILYCDFENIPNNNWTSDIHSDYYCPNPPENNNWEAYGWSKTDCLYCNSLYQGRQVCNLCYIFGWNTAIEIQNTTPSQDNHALVFSFSSPNGVVGNYGSLQYHIQYPANAKYINFTVKGYTNLGNPTNLCFGEITLSSSWLCHPTKWEYPACPPFTTWLTLNSTWTSHQFQISSNSSTTLFWIVWHQHPNSASFMWIDNVLLLDENNHTIECPEPPSPPQPTYCRICEPINQSGFPYFITNGLCLISNMLVCQPILFMVVFSFFIICYGILILGRKIH